MKTRTVVAITLITMGIVGLVYQGITYETLPPIAGAIALVGGIVLLVVGNNERMIRWSREEPQ